MRAISLHQPWATLVAIRAKQFETRSWGTDYRGPIAIHASRHFPNKLQRLCCLPPFGTSLHKHGIRWTDLPRGAIVAIATIAACQQIKSAGDAPSMRLPEFHFGDWRIGRYAWHLENVIPLRIPLTTPGHQRWWNVEGICRVCGCTEAAACEGGCFWAEPDLCSACVKF